MATRMAEAPRSRRLLAAAVLALGIFIAPLPGIAQTPPAAPATAPSSAIPSELVGKPVEEVRIVGRTRPLSASALGEIRRQIRTQQGDKFDPQTVREDYQRVYGLRKFGNVEARVEPTTRGVVVVFDITEQDLIRSIAFRGNKSIDTADLQQAIDLQVNEALDVFRLTAAREAIVRVYREANYPYAHVDIPGDPITREGAVVFNIVEGPKIRIRKVDYSGNRSFTDGRLDSAIKTASWFPVLRPGTFDPDQIEQDVAAIRQFYEDHGFFDARVGRKLSFSPDWTELQVTFVIDEGPRYTVDRVSFRSATSAPLSLSDDQLRQNLRLTSGRVFDRDLERRDVRQIVKEYSPTGYVYYQPPGMPGNPDYLQIRPKQVFRREAGKVDIVYEINEGRPFRLGQIQITGNDKTQTKVILREMRTQPGALYNSAALQEGIDRLKATGFFQDVRLTPIGDQPAERDVLIEVVEQSTSRIMLGAALSSANGVMGNITYEQKNFDISAVPTRFSDITQGRAFVGAGQYFQINLEPGTEVTRASVNFVEPWIFDQPYSFGTNLFYNDRHREDWVETRLGARLFVGKRLAPNWSVRLTFRGEDIDIHDMDDEIQRAPEILQLTGHSTLTSLGLEVKRDTTNSPILPSGGSVANAAWEGAGAFGGNFYYSKFTAGYSSFHTLTEDLLERKTILNWRLDGGYITGDAPFFERFYAGERGSVRGFAYRGISPRSGSAEDPVGGNFMLTGSVEVTFPLYSDSLRGALFADGGTVERGVEITTIRSAAGVGVRWTLPLFGQVPLAFDIAVPITKGDQDDLKFFSFAFGLSR